MMTNSEVNLTKHRVYTFTVVVEPDEDRWFAYCPALHKQGAATWGYTRQEAISNIKKVVKMVIGTLTEDNEPIP
ncbi:MAG: type II toxin-antitoxin system HicB family antitoxin [Magnetococcales bacterium]|nr:type II toxin-antitoxin system HicB family antitoxin [Nitrospirota bacterium]